jgi:hypothetical protein
VSARRALTKRGPPEGAELITGLFPTDATHRRRPNPPPNTLNSIRQPYSQSLQRFRGLMMHCKFPFGPPIYCCSAHAMLGRRS